MNLKWMICPLMISLFFLAACSPSSVEPSVNPSDMTSENSMPAIDTTPAEEEMATPEAPGADFTSGEVPQEMFDAVLGDLLTNTGETRAHVTLVKAEQVTWNDGSLGCPEPGVMYTQALIDGYQVVLSVGDKSYDYHLSDRGNFVLCENSFSPGISGGTPTQ